MGSFVVLISYVLGPIMLTDEDGCAVVSIARCVRGVQRFGRMVGFATVKLLVGRSIGN